MTLERNTILQEILGIGEEEIGNLKTSSVSVDLSTLEEHWISPIVKSELVLIGEEFPGGEGGLIAFTSKITGELAHLRLVRVIEDKQTGDQIHLELRYSPNESPFMRFDAWPNGNFPLHNRIPPDHRISGMPLPVSGQVLVMFAQQQGMNL